MRPRQLLISRFASPSREMQEHASEGRPAGQGSEKSYVAIGWNWRDEESRSSRDAHFGTLTGGGPALKTHGETGISSAVEGLGCGGDDLFGRDVAEPLSDVPAVTERVAELAVALAPERVGEFVACLRSGVDCTGPEAVRVGGVDLENGGGAPDGVGETMPMSGNSLPTCTTESPKASSTVITLSPGSGMRLSSCAPNAVAYQPAASAASRTTMCAAMFIAGTVGQVSPDVLYV